MRKARNLFLLALLVGLLEPMGVCAQDRPSVAVFPFTGAGIPSSDLRSLTLAFEGSLLRFDSIEVIEESKREKVLAFLEPSLLACSDIDCALRAGRLLSADSIVFGTISRSGDRSVLSVKVVDLRTGKSRQAESEGSRSPSELASAARLLAATLFAAGAGSAATGSTPAGDVDDAQRLKALESLAANIRASIAEIDRKRATARAWGWVFMGVGVASAGASGVFWYLADQAFQSYKSTSDSDLAATYHSRVILWDTLMLVGAGAGLLSIGGSIPFFVLPPGSRAEKAELQRVEAEIAGLENAQGARR